MDNKDMPVSANDIDWQSFDLAYGGDNSGVDTHNWVKYREGLTKREHFIAMAMQGLCAYSVDSSYGPAEIPSDAISIADKTLKLMEVSANE